MTDRPRESPIDPPDDEPDVREPVTPPAVDEPPPEHDEDPPPPSPEQKRSLDQLESVLLRINGLGTLANDLKELRALLYERRPPRIATLGRRGAGKSSLANALLGAEALTIGAVEDTTTEPGWVRLSVRGRALQWLDTPGLRAGAAPERREVVRRALSTEPPDIVLVAVRATQVDSGVDEDVTQVKWLLDRVKATTGKAPPVIAVVTRADEVAPVTVRQPPFPATKRAAIDKACGVLRAHLERNGVTPAAVVPVGAYMRFFKDHTLAVDWRWNLEALSNAVFDALPATAQTETARAFEQGRALRRRVAQRIVHTATSLAFFVGTAPVPVADLAVLAPLQGVMVTGVMYVAGRRVDGRGVSEWLTALGVNVGAGLALREAARGLVKLIPGLGTAVSGAIAATGTWALGSSAVRYFVDHASADEAREAFEAARRAGAPSDAGEHSNDDARAAKNDENREAAAAHDRAEAETRTSGEAGKTERSR